MNNNSLQTVTLSIPPGHKALADAFKFIPGIKIAPNEEAHCVLEDTVSHFSLHIPQSSLSCDFKKPVRFGLLLDEIPRLTAQHEQSVREKPVWLGNVFFDPRHMCVKRGEETIELTEKEIAVLQTLLHATPEAVSRDDLLQSVWGYHPDVTTHTVETHLWRLRQKIEIDPSNPEIVVTTPEGYKLGVRHEA